MVNAYTQTTDLLETYYCGKCHHAFIADDDRGTAAMMADDCCRSDMDSSNTGLGGD